MVSIITDEAFEPVLQLIAQGFVFYQQRFNGSYGKLVALEIEMKPQNILVFYRAGRSIVGRTDETLQKSLSIFTPSILQVWLYRYGCQFVGGRMEGDL